MRQTKPAHVHPFREEVRAPTEGKAVAGRLASECEGSQGTSLQKVALPTGARNLPVRAVACAMLLAICLAPVALLADLKHNKLVRMGKCGTGLGAMKLVALWRCKETSWCFIGLLGGSWRIPPGSGHKTL